jgi:prepilin-type N-terminal cleavage/methylation domain-containing protein
MGATAFWGLSERWSKGKMTRRCGYGLTASVQPYVVLPEGEKYMSHKSAFTLIELLVVIAVIAVLMAILLPALNRAREQGKRAACLNNVKQMALAWNVYADDNDGRIVNANTSVDGNATPGAGYNRDETCWVYWPGDDRPLQERLDGIRRGLIYPYCPNEKIYKCPTGVRGEVVTYAIPDAMNGHYAIQGAAEQIKTLRTQIRNLSEQVLFLDEGRLSPSSWTIWYDQERARSRSPKQTIPRGKTAAAKALSQRSRATKTCIAYSAASSADWATRPATGSRTHTGAGWGIRSRIACVFLCLEVLGQSRAQLRAEELPFLG